ncbi:helix-turn-helix domain-containing protein [Nonomuraea turkmeniaca]|uniref:Helix-turn-helix domain-containing protein n=1 Tax=Nonomuraea turkmeniaca TaxID=103838 RepID=A0A5S4FPV7_9ACTN|nr:helix-turn-helix transcriptional regulator [Nonomuraea turkmeniaca]TMR22221.1 helix-turn-helix domain-containing protein [Nonomuraea turkmeniaca]
MRGLTDNELGRFLRSRREQLDPSRYLDPSGYVDRPANRRRTPGLRRSEIAARANISVEWYTRLEQGRGGVPSAKVLDAVCDALELRPDEREHVHLLAFGRAGPAVEQLGEEDLARLQRLVDAITCPAYIKSAAWDVVVWNAAAASLLTDYDQIPIGRRNVLRILFSDPAARARVDGWWHEAKLAVATFRLELGRWAFTSPEADRLIGDLYSSSPDFAAIWDLNEVGHLGQGVKDLAVPGSGRVRMQYEALSLDAYAGFGLVIYNFLPADQPTVPGSPRSPR